jgi:cysteinyl-tRNA synthetase
MPLRVYNTLTKKKEEFIPLTPGKVGIYTCGITAYDVCHVGHARSAVVFDMITRYLRYRGYDVTYVRNFTDVDDKIIDKAKRLGVKIAEVAERFIAEHDRDMDALGVEKPTVSPRATENIDGMIRLIEALIEKGLAYVVNGDVYYAVSGFKDYGKLSGRNLEDMMAGARIDINEQKRHPMDFALWKTSKEGEPCWESPWGKGRPGWHIECSVMSRRFLGETFDIHGGGEDLIFPHHENEIAQSEGATGKPLARYWIHNGFVRVNSEKMSKSLGNFSTIQDMLQQYHPEALRLFMLQSHYRSPVDFSDDSLVEARIGMERFYTTLKAIKDGLAQAVDTSTVKHDNLSGKHEEVMAGLSLLRERFVEAMDDDFNSARALGYIFDAVRLINGYLNDAKTPLNPEMVFVISQAKEAILEVGRVLGLYLDDPDAYFRQDRVREAVKRGFDVGEIDRLVEERRSARASKDWKRADELRQVLADKKIVLKDTPERTIWMIA